MSKNTLLLRDANFRQRLHTIAVSVCMCSCMCSIHDFVMCVRMYVFLGFSNKDNVVLEIQEQPEQNSAGHPPHQTQATPALFKVALTILVNPSPNTNPEATTIMYRSAPMGL